MSEGLVVVSLFDGMACGLAALKRAGINVKEYHAFEVDKYAIQVAKKNHPEIIHYGEINFMTDFSQFKNVDLLIGGSPCQGFSMAGKQLNFKDPRSQLFFEFVRARNEMKPKHFLLENVIMKNDIRDAISQLMGVEPIRINSALVSAQNRERYYWCNWANAQPEDRGIHLKDIIEDGIVDRDKSFCLDASYYKGGNLKSYFEKNRRQLVFQLSNINPRVYDVSINECGIRPYRSDDRKSGISELGRMLFKDSAARVATLTTTHTPKVIDELGFRKLTPIECERLQTLPDNYTAGVSNSQRYKMLGNGWTVEVIVHLLKGIKQ